MVLAKYWGGAVAGIISASRGSSVRRAVRSPLSGSSRLSAAITTTAQVTSLNIRPLGGEGDFYVLILTRLKGGYFAWGNRSEYRVLGRVFYRWVISAILGLAKSHGSTLPPLETSLTPRHDGILGKMASLEPLLTLDKNVNKNI